KITTSGYTGKASMLGRRFACAVPFGVAVLLGGCGTYVPEIQENPFATERERSDFIQAIVRNVRCEVQDAVVRLYAENQDIDPYNRNLGWVDPWAAQISLTSTLHENGAFNADFTCLQPSPSSVLLIES